MTTINAFLLALSMSMSLACSSTTFSSSADQKQKKNSLNTDEDTNRGGEDHGGDDYDGGNSADLGGSDGGSDGANDLGGYSSGIELDECLSSKADNYNLVLIFDNSGSQLKTDPQAVRREGALAFVDQFASYTKKHKKAVVNLAVLKFNTTNQRVSHGWVRLNEQTHSMIKDNIAQATANPSGGTAYSPSLRDAAQLYGELLPQTKGTKSKNYVIFLTDGLPNAASLPSSFNLPGFGGGERMEDIPAAVSSLVSNYQVAMIAIASGGEIPPEGEALAASLAKPEVGIKDAKHVGVYRRAASADALKSVWTNLLATIGDCD